jgi:hypothetical protein
MTLLLPNQLTPKPNKSTNKERKYLHTSNALPDLVKPRTILCGKGKNSFYFSPHPHNVCPMARKPSNSNFPSLFTTKHPCQQGTSLIEGISAFAHFLDALGFPPPPSMRGRGKTRRKKKDKHNEIPKSAIPSDFHSSLSKKSTRFSLPQERGEEKTHSLFPPKAALFLLLPVAMLLIKNRIHT